MMVEKRGSAQADVEKSGANDERLHFNRQENGGGAGNITIRGDKKSTVTILDNKEGFT